jgi:photosystem II stability/assembly factor-like uncharacterized protein
MGLGFARWALSSPRVISERTRGGGVGAIVLTLVAALAFGACGSGEDGETFQPLALQDPGPVHVHGLGINPEDGSLFVATHTGLWRVGANERKAERVGESYQDTMGFTVLGPNRFLGSGHPDLRDAREQGLPPLLGLIESRDEGKTWSQVSLLGEADFHVLRSSDDRVYGFDATNIRLLISDDAGASWNPRALPGFPPEPLIDLALDPSAPDHLVATSEAGLYESRDEGRTWKRLGDLSGLLAWPSAGHLYLVAGGGLVFASEDVGGEWASVGQIGGEPAALLAASAEELYVALHDGTIKHSIDGGVTWKVRSTP